ncbi:hypothetical protein, partial [Pseudomonas sp. EZ-C24]|uniref:hypothetical protein n=1 Tax=Pseudomonas sp. EZ-C24 TaxID=2753617 RepID=UPI001CB745D4
MHSFSVGTGCVLTLDCQTLDQLGLLHWVWDWLGRFWGGLGAYPFFVVADRAPFALTASHFFGKRPKKVTKKGLAPT